MLIVDGVFLPRSLLKMRFSCPYEICGGACCVVGEGGAPIQTGEIDRIKEHVTAVLSLMDAETTDCYRRFGFFQDDGGGYSTTCVNGTGRCIFTQITNDSSVVCVLETISKKLGIKTLRPVSCRLFPLRIRSFNGIDIIDVEFWNECKNAWGQGPFLLEFCQSALIDAFGLGWMEKLNRYFLGLRKDMG
ncbi:MAG: DUF3109 family protein [bacterium]